MKKQQLCLLLKEHEDAFYKEYFKSGKNLCGSIYEIIRIAFAELSFSFVKFKFLLSALKKTKIEIKRADDFNIDFYIKKTDNICKYMDLILSEIQEIIQKLPDIG